MAVNLRAIAQKTGLSTATVSMALRGLGRIPEATRERVRAAAEELGYRPSPLLSKAFQLARQPEPSRYRETLAALTEFSIPDSPPYQHTILESAQKRGESLGYKVDFFQVSGNPAEQRRLDRILTARGIRGLIILPRLEHRRPRLHLSWAGYAAVEIGRTLWHPRGLHRLERPVYQEVLESCHLLKKAGYRRIGLAVEPSADTMRQMAYTAAYRVAQELTPGRAAIPPLSHYGPWDLATFRVWFEQFRPDVLLVHANNTVPEWLETLGLQVPRDVSVFGTNAGNSPLAGLTSDTPRLGENAVELLSLLLERDQLGLAPTPHAWQVRALWKPGHSLDREIDHTGPEWTLG
jgi:DNA-binding LacI/PurR family transcriptional regulator